MIKLLQRRFALSRQGAVDLIKGCIACVAQDISFMIPVGLLYFFVLDMMNGGVRGSRIPFYVIGAFACLALIFIVTWFQYNATYLATYVESGVRRISLAETASKDSFILFRQEGSCGSDQFHYERLRYLGNCFFPLCACFGRVADLNHLNFHLSVFL